MCPNKDRPQFLEITVIFVLDFSGTPGVLAAFDHATILGFDILFGANYRERHGRRENTSMMRSGFIIFLDGGLVDFDALCFDDSSNLKYVSEMANESLIGFNILSA